MRKPRQIPARIPQLTLPVPLSPSSYELFRSRLKEYRRLLSVVLVSLEQEYGQSIGVVSHLFIVWRVVVVERRQPFSYYVVLICCWWLSLGRKSVIKRSEVMKFTGLSASQCTKHLHKAFRAGYLGRYSSDRHYYITPLGAKHINEFFGVVLDAVMDLYDNNK